MYDFADAADQKNIKKDITFCSFFSNNDYPIVLYLQLATAYAPAFININLYYFMTIVYGLAFFINLLAAIWYLVGSV